MKKFIASLLIASQVLVSSAALADPISLPSAPQPVPGEVDLGAAISPMKKGQVAPFTGVLLSPKALATIVVQLNSIPEQVKIEVDYVRAEDKARCDFEIAETTNRLETDKKVLQAQIETQKSVSSTYLDVIKKQEDSRPNTSLILGLGAGAGFVVGLASTLLVVHFAK